MNFQYSAPVLLQTISMYAIFVILSRSRAPFDYLKKQEINIIKIFERKEAKGNEVTMLNLDSISFN